jgi:hypothetical protein
VFFLCENLPNEIWLRAHMLAHRPTILVCVDRGNSVRLRSIILLVGREHRQKHAGLIMLRPVVIDIAVELVYHVF